MDITISQAGFCCVCGVCFAVGIFVGAYLMERFGGDNEKGGAK